MVGMGPGGEGGSQAWWEQGPGSCSRAWWDGELKEGGWTREEAVLTTDDVGWLG
jgi:hypothetical protein